MKRSKIIKILFIMVLCLGITACGKKPTIESVISEGAKDFQEGKSEEDLPMISSDQILNNLIAKYSDSRSEPTGSQISDDEADRIRKEAKGTAGDDADEDADDKADDAAGTDGSTGTDDSQEDTVPVVTSRQELKEAMHDMLDQTEEVLVFEQSGGYQCTIDDIAALYRELERDDPMDVHSVASYQLGGYPVSTLVLKYHIDTDQLIQMKEDTRDLLDDAVDKIDVTGMSQYEIVCAVNDYLCDTIVYPPNEPYAAETHTPYNAFKTGSAVCDGYSKAAKLMLNEYGVECDFVVGTCTNGGGHAWNLVKLEGEWYHMDVTWNDGGAEWDKDARKTYLLVTDDFMKQSRTWDTSLYPATPSNAYK